MWTSYLSTELSEIDTLMVQINLFIFQYSHGDYNVGPIMFADTILWVFLSPNLLKPYVFLFLFFTPFNKASETEGKGLQNSGQTSSVVWCRDLGNNERTRRTTRSK